MGILLNNKTISNMIKNLIGDQNRIGKLEILVFTIIIDISMLLLMLFFLPFDVYSTWGWTFESKTHFEYIMWMVGLVIIFVGIGFYLIFDLKIKKSKKLI